MSTVQPEEQGSIPLPPIPLPEEKAAREQSFAGEVRRLDGALAVAVVLLGFFLGAFTARNTDIWMHLATGRLIAQGQYTFGVDPFSFTSSEYWANHSWLYDVVVYGLASMAGGPETPAAGVLLIGIKAILLALLAGVMLMTHRREHGLWISSICTAIALLVVSPRAHLQPSTLSFLFLGITLLLLVRGGKGLWLLVPLFVLWVNMDAWFLFGPIVVGLYLLGQIIQSQVTGTGERIDIKTLAVVFVACLVACLISPHHVNALTLPVDLYSPVLSDIHKINQRLYYFHSPLEKDWYGNPGFGMNPAGLAFFPLLLLGLVSFGVNYSRLTWWRVFVWGAFAIIGTLQTRALPFFAVVAGPITAMNFEDFATRRFGTEPRWEAGWKQWALGGRVLTLLAGTLLLVLAFGGLLNARPDDPRTNRRFALKLEVDASLRLAAEQLQSWRKEGVLAENENGFNLSPDIANYCAWFAPGERGFFDYRFQLFPESGPTFAEVRQALTGVAPRDSDLGTRPAPAPMAWRKVFQQHNINHIILHENDSDAMKVRRQLQQDSWQWPLLYMNGRTTVYAWRDPSKQVETKLATVKRFDPLPLAFGQPLAQELRAPTEGPGRWPVQQTVWSRLWQGVPVRPLEGDLAVLYLDYLTDKSQRWGQPYLAANQVAAWTGAISTAAIAQGNPVGQARLFFLARALAAPDFLVPDPLLGISLDGQGSGPPAPAYLAIRAARRGLAESPDHPAAYFILADAYRRLWRSIEDKWSDQEVRLPLGPRQTLREVQLATALRQGLLLRPDDETLHFFLADLYSVLGYLDLALDHYREAARLTASLPPQPGQSLEDFEKARKAFDSKLRDMESDVRTRLNQYEVSAANQKLLGRVQIALQNGLGKKALSNLLEADGSQFTPVEADLQIRLLILTGRVEDAKNNLSPELEPIFDSINYEWYGTLIASSFGDYREAGKFLEKALRRLEISTMQSAMMMVRAQTFQGLYSPSSLASLTQLPGSLFQLAEFRFIRGLIALEEGDIETAERYIRMALTTNHDKPGEEPLPFSSRNVAQRYLSLIEAAKNQTK